MFCRNKCLIFLFLVVLPGLGLAAEPQNFPNSRDFPIPEAYKDTVDFWVRVYGEWEDDKLVIHDSKNMDVILEVIDIPDENNLLVSAARASVSRKVDNIQSILLELDANPNAYTRSEEHKRLHSLYKQINDPRKFKLAAQNIRIQQGIKDRFERGLEQMTLYIDQIKKVFRSEGLPEELAYLPLVESSFNNQSLSRTRAAGIWQFMAGTAKSYMQVNLDVDERLDPFISSRGAARYLKKSYQLFGNWPVSLMSYNHGQQGIANAVRAVGSSDFMDIVNNYTGKYFGFASRNFYGEFLAACKVMHEAHKYFDELDYSGPLTHDSVRLAAPLWTSTLLDHSSLTREELRTYNPALQSSVIFSKRPIPSGYELRLPQGRFPDVAAFITNMRSHQTKLQSRSGGGSAGSESSRSEGSKSYTVKKGDSLYSISKRFSTTIETIRKLNRLTQSQIFPGQKLVISAH